MLSGDGSAGDTGGKQNYGDGFDNGNEEYDGQHHVGERIDVVGFVPDDAEVSADGAVSREQTLTPDGNIGLGPLVDMRKDMPTHEEINTLSPSLPKYLT